MAGQCGPEDLNDCLTGGDDKARLWNGRAASYVICHTSFVSFLIKLTLVFVYVFSESLDISQAIFNIESNTGTNRVLAYTCNSSGYTRRATD